MNDTQIYAIPQLLAERETLRQAIEHFVRSQDLVPPIAMEELKDLSRQFVQKECLEEEILGWVMVEINNAIWNTTLATIPFEKRILLIPQCLKNSAKCTAEIDEFGLLCNKCNSCSIPTLQENADRLGIMSLVAEGFTSVIGLVESGAVDAVIGVGCLDSLERAFPLLVNNAIPGMAIPLNCSGCKDTHVDCVHVNKAIGVLSNKETELLDYDQLKTTIKEWFGLNSLTNLLGNSPDHTSTIAHQWLAGEGKRWRPYLQTATYMAITGEKEIPEQVRLAAIAVECFHKASLVHDDIQDDDDFRYGEQTINSAHGVPIAINVGDILLGEGYKILTECSDMQLVKAAAEAHIALCKGQGMELAWSKSPTDLTMQQVLDIFCNKTVPAFDVALIFAVICANGGEKLKEVLHQYAHALGIGYQLKDDIEDFRSDKPIQLRPTAVLAAICEEVQDQSFIQQLLSSDDIIAFLNKDENKPLLDRAIDSVKRMANEYHKQAIDSLRPIKNVELKRLLFRITKRILD